MALQVSKAITQCGFFSNNMHLHNKSDIGIFCTKKNLELNNNKIETMCFIAPKQKRLSVD